MMKLYHNPKCSKSRQALQILQTNNMDVEIFEYLKTPPSEKELQDIVNKLGVSARDIIRIKEKEYKDSGIDNDGLSEDEIISILVKYPKLIERPILLSNEKAVIGRPPENVLKI